MRTLGIEKLKLHSRPAYPADFVVSTITACFPVSKASAFQSHGDATSGGSVTHDHANLSPWFKCIIGFQVFTWVIAGIASFVVCLIYWGFLVSVGMPGPLRSYRGRTLLTRPCTANHTKDSTGFSWRWACLVASSRTGV